MLLATVQGFAQDYSPAGNPVVLVSIGKQTVSAEVVASPEKLYLGLSHRDHLPPGRGMLFVLPHREIQHFCMRGMRFPIDIIWLDRNMVVGLELNIPPSDNRVFSSPAPVNLVLEVPGGWCRKNGITSNTVVTLPHLPIFP